MAILLSWDSVQNYSIARAIQCGDMARSNAFSIKREIVVGFQIMKRLRVFKHMENGHEHGASHGNGGSFFASARSDLGKFGVPEGFCCGLQQERIQPSSESVHISV